MIKFFDETSNHSSIDRYLTILIFMATVLIGSDRISIEIAGMTVRFVQLILIVIFSLLFVSKKLKVIDLIWFIPFIIANIISTIFSQDLFASVAYVIWTVFNYIVVYCLFFSWARNKRKEYVIDFWLLSFGLQSIYVLIQYIMGLFKVNDMFFPMQEYMDIYRPAIWFYEPSYLATYFSVFLTISFYLYINIGKSFYRYCTWISYFCILIISSTTGYLSIIISLFFGIVLTISTFSRLKLKRIGFSLLTLAAITASTYFFDPHMFNVFAGRLFQTPLQQTDINNVDKLTEDIIAKISESGIGGSSGGRVEGWLKAINVFEKHPIVGVGPNAYGKYMGDGIPATNVTLEIFANLGLIGFITFFIFLINIIIKGAKGTKREDYYGKAILFSFIVFSIVLQANQNYLRLYMWMHMGFIAGCCYFSKATNNLEGDYNK